MLHREKKLPLPKSWIAGAAFNLRFRHVNIGAHMFVRYINSYILVNTVAVNRVSWTCRAAQLANHQHCILLEPNHSLCSTDYWLNLQRLWWKFRYTHKTISFWEHHCEFCSLKLNPTHIWKLHIYIQLTGNFTSTVLSGKRVNVHCLSDAVRVSKFTCYSSKYMWEASTCSPILPQNL